MFLLNTMLPARQRSYNAKFITCYSICTGEWEVSNRETVQCERKNYLELAQNRERAPSIRWSEQKKADPGKTAHWPELKNCLHTAAAPKHVSLSQSPMKGSSARFYSAYKMNRHVLQCNVWFLLEQLPCTRGCDLYTVANYRLQNVVLFPNTPSARRSLYFDPVNVFRNLGRLCIEVGCVRYISR